MERFIQFIRSGDYHKAQQWDLQKLFGKQIIEDCENWCNIEVGTKVICKNDDSKNSGMLFLLKRGKIYTILAIEEEYGYGSNGRILIRNDKGVKTYYDVKNFIVAPKILLRQLKLKNIMRKIK